MDNKYKLLFLLLLLYHFESFYSRGVVDSAFLSLLISISYSYSVISTGFTAITAYSGLSAIFAILFYNYKDNQVPKTVATCCNGP
jgi:hypothetical protein